MDEPKPKKKDMVDVWLDFFDKYKEQQQARPLPAPEAPATPGLSAYGQLSGQSDQILSSCIDCPCKTSHCRESCRYSQVAAEAASAARKEVLTFIKSHYIMKKALPELNDAEYYCVPEIWINNELGIREQQP